MSDASDALMLPGRRHVRTVAEAELAQALANVAPAREDFDRATYAEALAAADLCQVLTVVGPLPRHADVMRARDAWGEARSELVEAVGRLDTAGAEVYRRLRALERADDG